ncbi:MAG: phosphatase PAP2 family protein [Candidatus Omnitrophica bacterium CG07_land_8_20_14_0_80_42_15]|uniref:Phosphatase PAP2 family protein n=1 Tax=Candidatus Aquitaenariimonas noxiae TaxID=1974741 RepID=A0A2J0L115_9BACT|nr:MAG: phosphatase PAP2 family protein [Candidatus Omnitrophica bacterium CG07_land_8_20_14_0_80_42_15]
MFIRFDVAILRLINQGCSNRLFDLLMPFITQLGNEMIPFLLGLILLLLRKREYKISGALLLAGLTIKYNVVYFLKLWVGRPRPFEVLTNINILEKASGFSFPSGHATTAFLVAFLMSARFKRPILFYSLAALVGISRIYLGAHFPSDVAAGALIGIVLGYLLCRVTKPIEKQA